MLKEKKGKLQEFFDGRLERGTFLLLEHAEILEDHFSVEVLQVALGRQFTS